MLHISLSLIFFQMPLIHLIGAAIGCGEGVQLCFGLAADALVSLPMTIVTLRGKRTQQSRCDLYDCLDNASFRFGVGFKICQHAVKAGAMCDPRGSVDCSILNQADDTREVGW